MSLKDDFLQISTPENVDFSFPVAGIGSRFIAALVDTTIIAILQVVVVIFGSLAAGLFFETPELPSSGSTLAAWVIGIFGLVGFVFLWGYYIFFEMLWGGQTPGKRLARLRVIRTDGGSITLTESVVRNLIRLIDFLPMIYGLGVVVMFINPQARRLGDLAAGTLVIREPAADLKPMKKRFLPNIRQVVPPAIEGYGALPIDRLTEQDLNLLQSFLQRRSDLSEGGPLSEQILARIFNRLELPLPVLDHFEIIRLFQNILAATENQTDQS